MPIGLTLDVGSNSSDGSDVSDELDDKKKSYPIDQIDQIDETELKSAISNFAQNNVQEKYIQHFTNSLNKLCLRIKTALITLIYRKAVVVRLDQLNKYSTGQIVNYMSIDTDSVVNAFPSFHSFWSLPFQICITLYLLYSQIGISFVSIINFFPIYFYNKYCLYLF